MDNYSIENKWLDHLNGRWCSENCDNLANRDSVRLLYNELILNKELIPVPVTNLLQNDVPMLPDFESETPLPLELNHYITTLLTSQLELARNVCSSTPFSLILKQRLTILKRTFYALWRRYHDREKNKIPLTISGPTEPIISDSSYSGSQALLEIGVHTGLSLLFALLKQNWQNNSSTGASSLCDDVLRTALTLVQGLPPLSLSSDAQLTPLGVNSLQQITKFLNEIVLQTSGVDIHGQLASELVLSLALQRGSLRYILEWIQMALDASCANFRSGKISKTTLDKSLLQMKGKKGSFNNKTGQDDVDLYDAAMSIMEELVEMAKDHESTCVKPKKTDSENVHIVAEKSDVYVWGSNSSHQLAEGAVEKIIVPTLSKAFSQAQQVWSAPTGAALIRTGDIVPTIPDRTQENIMLENVRKSHPSKRQPHVMDLSRECPTPKELQAAYVKLRDLCTPETVRQFWMQDGKFYSSLESSRWMAYVSQCLSRSQQAAGMLMDGTTVVLQEGNGQDLCCVVSSLTQLLLDPHWRTINGFQSLIQKEWIALGHPFASRLGHVIRSDTEQSPIFLLFLDCVWQLLQQFPQAFEFTETYLTTVWDSAHLTVFDTFLFNCEHDRLIAARDHNNPLILRSVWDWGEQFPDKEKELFNNPLYDESYKKILDPVCKIFFLQLWSQCYFRWIPLLEIPGGGNPQIDLHNRLVQSEIQALRQNISKGEFNSDVLNGQRDEQYELRMKVNSFFPFSNNSSHVSALQGVLTLNSTLLSGDGMPDTQSIMNAPD